MNGRNNPTEVLSRRALNRATLARQLLLRRSEMSPLEAIKHLVGFQAQTPHSWYVGLGTRLDGVRPEDVADLGFVKEQGRQFDGMMVESRP